MTFFDEVFQEEINLQAKQAKKDRQKKESKKFKFNAGDLIAVAMGLPPPSAVKAGAEENVLGMVSSVPIVGNILSGIVGAKDKAAEIANKTDMLDAAIKATEPKSPSSRLDDLFSKIKPLNTSAESAAQSTPSVDYGTPTGGNETLNDLFSLLRSLRPNG